MGKSDPHIVGFNFQILTVVCDDPDAKIALDLLMLILFQNEADAKLLFFDVANVLTLFL